MSNSSHNNSTSALASEAEFRCDAPSLMLLLLLDIITFAVGQPVVAALLWLSLTSKKSLDILNCNLALFNNVQYLLSVTHLCLYRLCPQAHLRLVKFMEGFAQTGGPLSMFSICMQRYVAVVYPTWYRLLGRYRYREACAAAVWVFSILVPTLNLYLAVMPTIAARVLNNIPFVMMLFMVWMVVNAGLQTGRRLKQPGPAGDRPRPSKVKAESAIRATSAITLGLYLPSLILSRVTDERGGDCLVASLSVMLLSAASVAQPLLYLATNGELPTCRGGAGPRR